MSRTWSGRYSTRFHLVGLVAAVVVPLIAFAALTVFRYAKAEQARVEQEAVRIAAQTGLLVEADLKQLIAKLEGLASSSALAADDLEKFHGEARLLTEGREETIIVRDLGTHQFLNSQLPFGTPLPSGPPFSPEERASFARDRPYVSDVYSSPRNGEPRVVVAVPVLRDGSPKYVIGITIPTLRIRDALVSAVPTGYIVAVGDRKGAYVARSARHEEVTGKPGLPEYVEQVIGGSGSFRSKNFEGRQLLAGYYRSALTGWFFTANIPTQTLEEPVKTSLLQLAGFGFAALVASGLLALLFSQKIVAATTGLAEQTRLLGNDETVTPIRSRLSEFALISDALVSASEAISMRSRERARATEREALLASIFDATGVYVAVVDAHPDDFRFVVANRAASEVFGGAAHAVVGKLASELDIQETDRREFANLCEKALSEVAPLTAEYALRLRRGETMTFLGTFTALPAANAPHGRVAFTAMDITDRKRSETHRQLLVNELNHRVKNSLTIAQSIGSQTLRSARSIEEARSALTARLVSLARTHDVLTRENWEGANVKDIADHIVEPYGAGDRIDLRGPPARLKPGSALTLSLLLHELMTNSAKYGALSSESGKIKIRWSLHAVASQEPRMSLTYEEADGPTVDTPTHRGFGSRLFAASFSAPDEGRIKIDYPPSGAICTIEMSGVVPTTTSAKERAAPREQRSRNA